MNGEKADIPPGSIFMCYRRRDSSETAGRIYDWLDREFPGAIFKDVDSIPFGVDFLTHIRQTLACCRIVLVVIGPEWLSAKTSAGGRRIDDPRDHVRIEIETALGRNDVRVIPLIVRDAVFPDASALPPSIEALVYRNGPSIRPDPDFRTDMERLIRQMRRMFDEAAKLSLQTPPSIVAAAEAHVPVDMEAVGDNVHFPPPQPSSSEMEAFEPPPEHDLPTDAAPEPNLEPAEEAQSGVGIDEVQTPPIIAGAEADEPVGNEVIGAEASATIPPPSNPEPDAFESPQERELSTDAPPEASLQPVEEARGRDGIDTLWSSISRRRKARSDSRESVSSREFGDQPRISSSAHPDAIASAAGIFGIYQIPVWLKDLRTPAWLAEVRRRPALATLLWGGFNPVAIYIIINLRLHIEFERWLVFGIALGAIPIVLLHPRWGILWMVSIGYSHDLPRTGPWGVVAAALLPGLQAVTMAGIRNRLAIPWLVTTGAILSRTYAFRYGYSVRGSVFEGMAVEFVIALMIAAAWFYGTRPVASLAVDPASGDSQRREIGRLSATSPEPETRPSEIQEGMDAFDRLWAWLRARF